MAKHQNVRKHNLYQKHLKQKLKNIMKNPKIIEKTKGLYCLFTGFL